MRKIDFSISCLLFVNPILNYSIFRVTIKCQIMILSDSLRRKSDDTYGFGEKRMNQDITSGTVPAYAGVYNRYVKRVLDVCISAIALLVLWRFYLVIIGMIAV